MVVEFFAEKGLAALKREDREESWYQDWIDFQSAHGLYASVLSPGAYSTKGNRLDLFRLTRFAEVFAYFSPAHAYSLQVSILGLFPILMGSNEALKREAVARLEAGGLFAFGVSERAHGADLLANEFAVSCGDGGGWVANGTKCYIGNANAAGIISVLARDRTANPDATSKRAPFLFFALRPAAAAGLTNVRKIRTSGVRTAFVGEFEVRDHPVQEADVISRHRDAWASFFATVDFGKFFLGFGSVGICEHAFVEAMAHLRARTLYGKPVIALPHLRETMAVAFARLAAMKMYAYRALDYLQTAGPDDRRYLLFSAVQKARVSTEGVKVLAAVSECVGARGFESDTFIESALRDGVLIPGLEGSTHINFAQAVQFVGTYFAPDDGAVASPGSVSLGTIRSDENPYWMTSRDRNAKTVRFAPPLTAYEPLRGVRNVALFAEQVAAFGPFARAAAPDQARQVALGRCFSIVAFGQLVAENCALIGAAPALVSVIFHTLVADLSAECLNLANAPAWASERAVLRALVSVPETTAADLDAVADWSAARYAPGATA